jgi:Flp pilus assembly protein TadD
MKMSQLSHRFAAGTLLACALAASAWAADTPSGPPVSERLATARNAINAKDWTRAMSELNAAVREEPRNADVHNLLGYSYRKRATPDLAKAFDHYNTALKLNPNHKGAHEYIGEAYLMDKKPAEAEKHLAQLEALCGNKTCEEYVDLSKAIASYKASN